MDKIEEMWTSRGRKFEPTFIVREPKVVSHDPRAANRRFDFVFVDVTKNVPLHVSLLQERCGREIVHDL